MIGSTPFRRNIFNKHHIDKNAMIIKSGMTAATPNVTPDNQNPPAPSQNNHLNLNMQN